MFFLYVNTILFLYCYTVHEKHCKMMDMINKGKKKKKIDLKSEWLIYVEKKVFGHTVRPQGPSSSWKKGRAWLHK